jgi:ankyrin repeat protein
MRDGWKFLISVTLIIVVSCGSTQEPSAADSAEIARALLESGADVNCRGQGGRSSLMYAKDTGRTRIVDMLTEAGAEE